MTDDNTDRIARLERRLDDATLEIANVRNMVMEATSADATRRTLTWAEPQLVPHRGAADLYEIERWFRGSASGQRPSNTQIAAATSLVLQTINSMTKTLLELVGSRLVTHPIVDTLRTWGNELRRIHGLLVTITDESTESAAADTPKGVSVCGVCREAVHASMSNDDGNHHECSLIAARYAAIINPAAHRRIPGLCVDAACPVCHRDRIDEMRILAQHIDGETSLAAQIPIAKDLLDHHGDIVAGTLVPSAATIHRLALIVAADVKPST